MRMLGDNYSIGDLVCLGLSIGALLMVLVFPNIHEVPFWWLLLFLQGWNFVDLVSTRTTKVHDVVLASAVIYTTLFTIYRWLLNDLMKALISVVFAVMITNFIFIFIHMYKRMKNRVERYLERRVNNE